MLENAVGSYLDTLEEREFDEPFMAILRAQDYYDIQFLHGLFEFGKDFIAKKRVGNESIQYAFQTKAGNLDAGAWRNVRGQIDDMRMTRIAHPSFDASLRRVVVLVTTGRLVGQAAASAQDYKEYVAQTHAEEFEVWDRDDLVAILASNPELGLAGVFESDLLGLIAAIDGGAVLDSEVERFSRRWIQPGNTANGAWRSVMEAAVLCNRLRRTMRLDLACLVSLALMRAAWTLGHGREPINDVSLAIADMGRGLFIHYAMDMWRQCTPDHLDPDSLYRSMRDSGSFMTYPVRCVRLAEVLGLLGLALAVQAPEQTSQITEFLAAFVAQQPGATHPVSDHWAVSIVAPALLLGRSYPDVVGSFLKQMIKWVADHYDEGELGLAPVDTDPSSEIDYLVGSPLEHIQLHRRETSYLATVILDLASVLEFGDVYELARNDLQAVGAIPELLTVQDTPGQYVRTASDTFRELNPRYSDEWQPADQWKVAPHHRAAHSLYLDRIGRSWDLIAISSVVRDRHFLVAMRAQLAL